jgi:hypothetical protein
MTPGPTSDGPGARRAMRRAPARALALALAASVVAASAVLPRALAAAAAQSQGTTAPSLTGSFPLGRQRLHRSPRPHQHSRPPRSGSTRATRPTRATRATPAHPPGSPPATLIVLLVGGAICLGLVVGLGWKLPGPRSPARSGEDASGWRRRRRHPVSASLIRLLWPLFRYSRSRRAYVLRVAGGRRGPVLVERGAADDPR